jgi:uncharacterized protein YqeY
MSLENTINDEIKKAMIAKDQAGIRGLRAIKAAIILAKTEKGAGPELSAEKELQILQKLVKQRRESISIFEQQNRADLAQTEKEEVEIIERFLPKALSAEEITALVQEVIRSSGATGIKDMGKVMGLVNKEAAGRADGKLLAEEVKKLLGS